MKLTIIAAAVMLAAAPAFASTAPRAAKVHVVEGEWPSVMETYAPWAVVRVSYPVIDGTLDRYAGSFDVARDGALRAVEHAPGAIGDQKRGHVRLERKDGEKLWHVVAFTPERD